MRLSKKKFALFLLTIALFSGATATFAIASENSSKDSGQFLRLSSGGSGLTAGTDDDLGPGKDYFKMMLTVFIVIVLGIGAIYLSKKLLPGLTNLSGKQIRIIETVHLGPRKAVHLLKIGGKQILIGSTNENITRLADVMDESSEVCSTADQISNN